MNMENENYRNPELSPADRAADLLGRLTVEEKMAQTIGFLPRDAEDEKLADVTRYGIGEISTLEVRRLKSKEDAAAFQRRIQKTVMENSRFHIPAIFHMEGLCGAFIQDAMSFPSGIARGSSFDPVLEKKIAQVVAGQERMAGFTEFLYAYGYPVAGNDDSHFEEALKAVSACDLCILTLGGKHGSCSVATMGEGVDGSDINLPECQDRFIEAAASLGKPMVGIHFNGRPISSDAADRYLDAILEAWNPSETGAEAIAEVLTGKVNPSGKLPVSVAYNAGQIPIYYNHPCGSSWDQGASIGFSTYVDLPHLPRYCFGYGLSYTSFEYSDLALSAGETGPDGAVDIGCRVRNTGAAAGTEVVQLYVKDEYASMVRPAMQLAGFRKVSLQPGEEQQVCFHLAASFLAFLDVDYRWKIEKGEIRVMIGAASDDIRLQDHFTITGDRFIEGRTRQFRA